MNSVGMLHNFGQSLWLDNLSRDLLNGGSLMRYISESSVSGVTTNPTIFDHAIKGSTLYDNAILDGVRDHKSNDELFLDLALSDVQTAADLLLDVHKRTNGLDGWVSLEVPPAFANDFEGSVAAATSLARRVGRPNVFIKVPGTAAGLHAIEELIYRGIPINITLLFSPEQYVAAAGSYLTGVERRIVSGLSAAVPSVASVFISRWDVAVKDRVAEHMRNRLGPAIGSVVYHRYRELMLSNRWQRVLNFGGQFQRLLWASTGSKDPAASPTLYLEALAAPFTINTMPDATLMAASERSFIPAPMSVDTTVAQATLDEFALSGVNVEVLGAELQAAGVASFAKSWQDLMDVLAQKGATLANNAPKS